MNLIHERSTPLPRPSEQDARQAARPERTARHMGPFFGASLLAWIAVPLGSSMHWGVYAASVGLAILAGVLGIVALPGVLTKAREAIPSMVFLLAIALLRDSAGGVNSAVGTLALLPVFYTALYSNRVQLCTVLVGMTTVLLAQNVLIGPPAYPHSQYRAGVIFIVVSAIIGLVTQRLVAQAQAQAADAQHRERMLEQIAEVVRNLSHSSRAREEVCEAAKTISNASMAILYEPANASGLLRSSAKAGLEGPAIEIGLDEHSGVREAFRSGQSLFFDENSDSEFFNSKIWQLSGEPTSVLFEPLLRGGETVGVLVVGWPQAIRVGGSRATAIALLAHEVAAVIERADMLIRLTDMASTDALTGLPNRRAWETSLERALAEDQSVALAMLDLDHFKEFNDTQGHPAGDRLLRETAAAWREELRAGDLVARLGGDEFALLLPDCNAANALEVVERLRLRIPGEQTCSAGIATHEPGSPPEALMAQADTALYEAKTAGRNRTCLTPV
jgi:diguanylate cyclase (GGDEF)-like protein